MTRGEADEIRLFRIWLMDAAIEESSWRGWSASMQCARPLFGVPVYVEVFYDTGGPVVGLSLQPSGEAPFFGYGNDVDYVDADEVGDAIDVALLDGFGLLMRSAVFDAARSRAALVLSVAETDETMGPPRL